MNFNVLHLNSSSHEGGAARAAQRLHQALLANGIDSSFISGDPKAKNLWRHLRARWRYKGFRAATPGLHTIAWPDTNLGKQIYKGFTTSRITHLHWLGDDLLSIEQVGALKQPLCWTLHDMWPFSGAEHYTTDNRYLEGYFKSNRPIEERGKDLNQLTWRRKLRAWHKPTQLIAPSNWLKNCAQQSALFRDWPIVHIPNAIDPLKWHPLDKKLAKQALCLPVDRPLVLFVAMGGLNDPRKGSDILQEAMLLLRNFLPAEMILVGGKPSSNVEFPCHGLGAIEDDRLLKIVYAASDVIAIPSRLDNLPNTSLEAQMCGIPVVAFKGTGVAETIDIDITGAIAEEINAKSLASALLRVLKYLNPAQMAAACRERAIRLWDPSVVANAHIELYQDILAL